MLGLKPVVPSLPAGSLQCEGGWGGGGIFEVCRVLSGPYEQFIALLRTLKQQSLDLGCWGLLMFWRDVCVFELPGR